MKPDTIKLGRRSFLMLLPVVLAGCGFQLRRLDGVPFASMHLDAPADSAVSLRIRKALEYSGHVRLVSLADQAEAVLKLGQENRSKTILSLSGAGRVTEYRLGYRLSYSVAGKDGRVWIDQDKIDLTRDFTYSDSALFAKAAEEQLLYRNMEDDAAQQILRRLRSLKLSQLETGRSSKLP